MVGMERFELSTSCPPVIALPKIAKIAPHFTPVNKGENKASVTECKVQFRYLPICLPFVWNDYSSPRSPLLAAVITQVLAIPSPPMISTAGVSAR